MKCILIMITMFSLIGCAATNSTQELKPTSTNEATTQKVTNEAMSTTTTPADEISSALTNLESVDKCYVTVQDNACLIGIETSVDYTEDEIVRIKQAVTAKVQELYDFDRVAVSIAPEFNEKINTMINPNYKYEDNAAEIPMSDELKAQINNFIPIN